MNPERRAIRRVSAIGLLAAIPIATWAATCASPDQNQPQNLAGGNNSEPTRAAQIPNLPSVEPTLAPTVESAPTASVDELYESAHMLALRSPQVADIELYLGAAQTKHDQNPNDPQIASDIAKSVRVLIANDEICQDPQDGISSLARGFTEEAVNYLKETNPSSLDQIDQENACLEGASQDSQESETQDLGYEIRPSKYEDQITIVEPNRQYNLFKTFDLEAFKAETPEIIDLYPISEEKKNEIKALLSSLTEGDPEQIAKLKQMATLISENVDYQTCQEDTLAAGIMSRFVKDVATDTYLIDPSGWGSNKAPFVDNKCFWGEYY